GRRLHPPRPCGRAGGGQFSIILLATPGHLLWVPVYRQLFRRENISRSAGRAVCKRTAPAFVVPAISAQLCHQPVAESHATGTPERNQAEPRNPPPVAAGLSDLLC